MSQPGSIDKNTSGTTLALQRAESISTVSQVSYGNVEDQTKITLLIVSVHSQTVSRSLTVGLGVFNIYVVLLLGAPQISLEVPVLPTSTSWLRMGYPTAWGQESEVQTWPIRARGTDCTIVSKHALSVPLPTPTFCSGTWGVHCPVGEVQWRGKKLLSRVVSVSQQKMISFVVTEMSGSEGHGEIWWIQFQIMRFNLKQYLFLFD